MLSYFLVSMGLQALLEHQRVLSSGLKDTMQYEGICTYFGPRVNNTLSRIYEKHGGFDLLGGGLKIAPLRTLCTSIFNDWEDFSGDVEYPIRNTLPSLMGDSRRHEKCYNTMLSLHRRYHVETEYRERYVALRLELLDFLIEQYQEVLVEMAEETQLCSSIFK